MPSSSSTQPVKPFLCECLEHGAKRRVTNVLLILDEKRQKMKMSNAFNAEYV